MTRRQTRRARRISVQERIDRLNHAIDRTNAEIARSMAKYDNRIALDAAAQDTQIGRVQNAMMSKLDHDLEAAHEAQAAAQSPEAIADREKVIDLIRQNRNNDDAGSGAGRRISKNER